MSKRWTTSPSDRGRCATGGGGQPGNDGAGGDRHEPRGTISHAGTQDIENVYVDWGDGTVWTAGNVVWPIPSLEAECSSGLDCGPWSV